MLSVPADWWPEAVRRPISYYTAAGRFAAPPIGWVPHVTDGHGSPFGLFENAPAGKRKFSHLFAYQDGRVEQYGPLSYKSWAQGDGNGTYLSFETEGLATEPYTDAQLDVLARFHVWSGAPDGIAAAPGQPGIGTHAMGGSAWGGHTCPDPKAGLHGPRSRQRAEIIRRAQALRGGDMPLSDAEWAKLRQMLDAQAKASGAAARDAILAAPYGTKTDGSPHTLADVWAETLLGVNALRGASAGGAVLDASKVATAIVAQIGPEAAAALATALRQAMVDVLHSTHTS